VAKKLTVEVASDVICPWCYIGKRRLEKALASVGGELDVQVRWLPFQLNPDMPPGGMSRADYRRAKFGSVERGRELDARVAAEGAKEGIAFAFDRMQRTPNTSRAHQLIDVAQKAGKAQPVVDALFRAYFEEAKDIGDEAVLAAIAQACGVEEWPRSAQAGEVQALEDDVRSLGIQAVPTFILDRKLGVSGAHPPESLVEAMKEAAST
jgi:predicted DsbA family dithiol-disulfide isomerase